MTALQLCNKTLQHSLDWSPACGKPDLQLPNLQGQTARRCLCWPVKDCPYSAACPYWRRPALKGAQAAGRSPCLPKDSPRLGHRQAKTFKFVKTRLRAAHHVRCRKRSPRATNARLQEQAQGWSPSPRKSHVAGVCLCVRGGLLS